MAKYSESYVRNKPLSRYIDGETQKHAVITGEATRDYWNVINFAQRERKDFGKNMAKTEELAVVEKASATSAIGAPGVKSYKSNIAAAVFGFLALLIVLNVAAMGALSYLKAYTFFFEGFGTRQFFDMLYNLQFAGSGMVSQIVGYSGAAAILVSVILSVAMLITFICAMTSKKRIRGIGWVCLASLLCWLCAGAHMFYVLGCEQNSAAIIEYINPLVTTIGAQWGYYICAVMLIVAMICGYTCYGSRK